jgi:allene oxide cyclase-like protein
MARLRASLALVSAGLMLAACGSDGGPGRTLAGGQTIRLHAREAAVNTIPNRGPVNAWLIGSTLTDARGARVGVGHAYCVASSRRRRPSDDTTAIAEGHTPLRVCVESFELRDGEITAQGEVLLGGTRTMPVVGGTGAYLGAIGELRTVATRRGDQEIVIRVANR